MLRSVIFISLFVVYVAVGSSSDYIGLSDQMINKMIRVRKKAVIV